MNSQTFLQPKSALLRSQELLGIGQKQEALETLESTIRNRKFKFPQWDQAMQEAVILAYVQLGIQLDSISRDCLVQYRNFCQNGQGLIPSLGKVLLELRTRAEEVLTKTTAAVRERDSKKPALGDDAVTSEFGMRSPASDETEEEAPENILLSTIQVEVSDEVDKEYNRALRMCLEVYRTIMDMIKVTPKLEKLYHETAHRAYDFCRLHNRSNEFKRLCELSRNHYSAMQKAAKGKAKLKDESAAVKADYQNLLRAEYHIETRLSQLKNASALNLWKEAMQIMEDLFELGIVDLAARRSSLKTKMHGQNHARQLVLVSVAAYYEKLAEIFGMANNQLFHALSLLKCISHTRQRSRQLSTEDFQVWASVAVLAVLAIPLDHTHIDADHPQSEEFRRLASLLGHPEIPGRASLINLLVHRGFIDAAFPEIQELYHVMETRQLLPFSVVAVVTPLLAKIEQQFVIQTEAAKAAQGNQPVEDLGPDCLGVTLGGSNFVRLFQNYLGHLKEAVFHKMVRALAKVYSRISIDTFVRKSCPPEFMSWVDAELCLVSLVQNSTDLNITIDYCSQTLKLGAEEKNDAPGVSLQCFRTLNQGLDGLTHKMKTALGLEPKPMQSVEAFYNALFASDRLTNQAGLNRQRLAQITTKRQTLEEARKKREEDLHNLEKEREQRQQTEELQRQSKIAKQKETEVRMQKSEKAKRDAGEKVLQLMQSIVAHHGASTKDVTIGGVPLTSLDAKSLLSGRIKMADFEEAVNEWVARSKNEKVKLLKADDKKVDHFVRAVRLEEIQRTPEWEARQAEYDRQCVRDIMKAEAAEKSSRDEASLNALKTVYPKLKSFLKAEQKRSTFR